MTSELERREQQFVERLRTDPNDDQIRQVYADFLEERGHTEQSEFLRLQVKLRELQPSDEAFVAASTRLRELAGSVDLAWRRVVGTAPIEACDDIRFDFTCPRQWASLQASSESEAVRFCDSCVQNVYYCTSLDEASTHAREGRCVVLDPAVLRRPGDLIPMPMTVPRPGMMPPHDEMLSPTVGMIAPEPAKKRSWWRRLLRRD